MTPLQFEEMCSSVTQCLQLPPSDTLARGDHVLVDGVSIGIAHNEEWDEGGVFCFVVLGEIGATCADPERVLFDALALNLELDAGLGESIGLERNTRQLIFRARMSNGTDDLYPNEIADRMSGYVELANQLYEGILSDVERPMLD